MGFVIEINTQHKNDTRTHGQAQSPAQTLWTARSLWDIYSSAGWRDSAIAKPFPRLQSLLDRVPWASDLKHVHENRPTEKLGSAKKTPAVKSKLLRKPLRVTERVEGGEVLLRKMLYCQQQLFERCLQVMFLKFSTLLAKSTKMQKQCKPLICSQVSYLSKCLAK